MKNNSRINGQFPGIKTADVLLLDDDSLPNNNDNNMQNSSESNDASHETQAPHRNSLHVADGAKI